MAHNTAITISSQQTGFGELQSKILLPPTDTNAEIIVIPGYKLVYCDGACPRTYRVYKGHSMLGLVFQHITHWSNAVDKVHYGEALDAAVGLDEFMKLALIVRTPVQQPNFGESSTFSAAQVLSIAQPAIATPV